MPGHNRAAWFQVLRFQRVQAVRKATATHPAPDVEPVVSLPEGSAKVRHLSCFWTTRRALACLPRL